MIMMLLKKEKSLFSQYCRLDLAIGLSQWTVIYPTKNIHALKCGQISEFHRLLRYFEVTLEIATIHSKNGCTFAPVFLPLSRLHRGGGLYFIFQSRAGARPSKNLDESKPQEQNKLSFFPPDITHTDITHNTRPLCNDL